MSYFRTDPFNFSKLFGHPKWVEGQPIEQPNVERPIFWNFEIPNIKRTKDESFDFLILNSFFYLDICLNYSNTKINDKLWNWAFMEFW